MHLNSRVLNATVFVFLACSWPMPVDAQPAGGVRVRVNTLKPWTFGHTAADGPVMIGPQSSIELEWRVTNQTGTSLEIPSLDAILRLRVTGAGGEIPVVTEWAADMALISKTTGPMFGTPVPRGPATLPDGSSFWVRASARRLDESVFAPGDYLLELEVGTFPQPAGVSRPVPVDRGFPISLRILEVNSPERQRQFHMVEGAFYDAVDRVRALEHYTALASLPGAPWSDSLPLARTYSELGRHREAILAYRRILPDLIRALNGPSGKILRDARHLRMAAMSLAAEGETTEATRLLRIEGRTPESRIAAEVEQLQKIAPKRR